MIMRCDNDFLSNAIIYSNYPCMLYVFIYSNYPCMLYVLYLRIIITVQKLYYTCKNRYKLRYLTILAKVQKRHIDNNMTVYSLLGTIHHHIS